VQLSKYYSFAQSKKNEMDLAYSTYGGEKKCVQNLLRKPDEKRPLEVPGLYRRMVIKLVSKN
jgi:hypothetical protein